MHPNEKKKTLVVGALLVAVLGIGAFRMVGSSPPPAPAAKGAAKPAAPADPLAGGKEPAKNPMYALALAARDPFQPAAFSVSPSKPAAPAGGPPPGAASALPALPPSGRVPSAPRTSEPPSSGSPAGLPGAMGGTLPPLGVSSGTLPPGLPPPGVRAAPAARPEAPFDLVLVGVVQGARPLAVFRAAGKSDGEERLVRVGETLDGSTRLLSIGPRRARVRFHGRILDLTIAEETSAPETKAPPTPPVPDLPSSPDAQSAGSAESRAKNPASTAPSRNAPSRTSSPRTSSPRTSPETPR